MSDPKINIIPDIGNNKLRIYGHVSFGGCYSRNPFEIAGIRGDPSFLENPCHVVIEVIIPRKNGLDWYEEQKVKELFIAADLNEFTTEALLKRASNIETNKPKNKLSREELIAILEISKGIENDETYESYHHLMTRTVVSYYTVAKAYVEVRLCEVIGSVDLIRYDYDTRIATFKLNNESFPQYKTKYGNSVIYFKFHKNGSFHPISM